MTSKINTVVLGHPIEHSLSPYIHNLAFKEHGIDGEMTAVNVKPEELTECIKRLKSQGISGASVTLPHKVEIKKYCDNFSEDALAIGAVNCLEFRSEKIIGHNTDAEGFVMGLTNHNVAPRGHTIALFGGGGAAKALHCKLKPHNVVDVFVRNPDKIKWCDARLWSESLVQKNAHAFSMLIDCTSIGLDEQREKETQSKFPIQLLNQDAVVSSLIYHRKTKMHKEALDRNLKVIDGLDMLVGQARLAFQIWTGVSFDHHAIIQKLRRI